MDAEKPAMTPQDFRFIANAIEHCRARSCPNCQGFFSADTSFKLREYADLAERALAAPPKLTREQLITALEHHLPLTDEYKLHTRVLIVADAIMRLLEAPLEPRKLTRQQAITLYWGPGQWPMGRIVQSRLTVDFIARLRALGIEVAEEPAPAKGGSK